MRKLVHTKLNFLIVPIFASLVIQGCGKLKKSDHSSESSSVPYVVGASTVELPPVSSTVPPQKKLETDAALDLANEKRSNVTSASTRVSTSITLKKSEIFDRVFLYGFDLQYSSVGNAEYSLLDQTMALGHVPAVFRKINGKLQLVADNSRLFESMVNHPETLINEYLIVDETEEELTITMDTPGMLLNKAVNGLKKPNPASSWLRSFEYVPEGEYILQESAIMSVDGEVQTFMESLFPRDTLVPKDYVGIEDNADKNSFSTRFMLLPGEKIFVEREKTNGVPVREQTAFATRYNLKNESSTIDWYVTENAPDELMGELTSGVIAWNRYFKDQLGRDVVRFMGRLPKNIKIGDPRYNVINFDTVAQAGAAYETQASDPFTGIQSHSLIYMPYAWYNIAAGLIKTREIPDSKTVQNLGPKSPEVLFGKPKKVVQCVRLADEASNSISPTETVDDFGRRVFISTLFHEMGHAFGLGHNFKASLSFDGSKPRDAATNPTTHSVMDYNYYQHETDLVPVIGTSEGRRLEYDRQAISYLYNKGLDIKSTDPVIPACDDDDADNKEGGIDQNCIRYDAENNPVVGLEHAFGRFADETGAKGLEKRTLTESIYFHRDELMAKLSDETITPDTKTVEALVKKKASGLASLITYYVAGGAQSLRVNLNLNAGALRKWRTEANADGITMPEAERRVRYINVLSDSIQLTELPENPRSAVNSLTELVSGFIMKEERFGTTEERAEFAKRMQTLVEDEVKKSASSGFARIRGGIAEKLIFDKELSFASGLQNGKSLEQIAVDTLATIAVSDLTSQNIGNENAVKARVNAVASLKTFAEMGHDYDSDISLVKAKLETLLKEATVDGKQDVKDHIRQLLKGF